jgi:hypothetical protein
MRTLPPALEPVRARLLLAARGEADAHGGQVVFVVVVPV